MRPVFSGLRAGRLAFSTGRIYMSNIGSLPILIPSGTSLKLTEQALDEVAAIRASLDKLRNGKPKIHLTQKIEVMGPRGNLSLDLADFVRISVKDNKATVGVEEPLKHHQRAMWGTSRSLVSNAISGVSEGHICIVKLVGTGFRAQLDEKKNQIVLRVGFSIPRTADIPEGVSVSIPVPHRIILEGCDKQKVRLLAAEIRAFRKPEPYKGKGIFIDDETIKLKQKKIK